MAYIGKSPQVGNYVKLDAITTSSTNTYNLTQDSVAFVPESALHMLVSLNGVIQSPLSSFSVSGSTITFLPSSGTLSSSDTIDFILVLGNTLDIGTPSDSTVTNAKTNFVSTSSSAGLQIKGDGTTDGTLQLNCSQNSHGVKIASPAHSAGQSYTLTLPTGNVTADTVLKVDSVTGSGTTGVGQLSFTNVGAIQLAQTSVTSSVATVDFNNTIIDSTKYRNFFFTVNNATCASGNYDLEMRFSSDNLSGFMTVIGQYEYQQLNGTDTGRQYNRSNHVITVDEENDETNASSGYGYILNADRKSSNNNTTNMFIFSRGSTINDNASGYYSYVSNSVCGSGSDPLNAIRFTGASNFTAGIFTIYGIPK